MNQILKYLNTDSLFINNLLIKARLSDKQRKR